MSPADYHGRKLRHRATGHEGVITTHATNVIGQALFRIRFADGSEDKISLGQIMAEFDWIDDPAASDPSGKVVQLHSRRARVVAIDPDGGHAA